jgi:hypothetical protein
MSNKRLRWEVEDSEATLAAFSTAGKSARVSEKTHASESLGENSWFVGRPMFLGDQLNF